MPELVAALEEDGNDVFHRPVFDHRVDYFSANLPWRDCDRFQDKLGDTRCPPAASQSRIFCSRISICGCSAEANELVAEIHDRMPAILARSFYVRGWVMNQIEIVRGALLRVGVTRRVTA
jgi:hypothetical protein